MWAISVNAMMGNEKHTLGNAIRTRPNFEAAVAGFFANFAIHRGAVFTLKACAGRGRRENRGGPDDDMMLSLINVLN